MFCCTNNIIIQRIKESFEFERISEEYIGTTASDSRIYFFKDNVMVFQSPFIFDENISIHFEKIGWVFSTNYDTLRDYFALFETIYNPIVVL